MEKTTGQGGLCSVFLTKYYSDDEIKKTEIFRAYSPYGESRGAYRVLVGKEIT
jgi:hypothetical protein